MSPRICNELVARKNFLEFRDVSMTFYSRSASVKALEGINFAFDEGSFVCLVGASGCGKTTLLQILGGFIKPSSGEVLLAGQPITRPGPDRGVVFQQPALFPWLSVYKNAEFGPMVRGVEVRERRQKVTHFLKMVGLWDFRDMFTYQLSGGMQQRLAIARALVNDPQVLLMDEPFGALDALTREKMQEELHGLWRRTGMTVVFVTHSVEEAIYLGTHVVVMSPRPGRVLELLPVNFSKSEQEQGMLGGNIRSIKASPEFVAAREHVLSLIWAQDAVGSGLASTLDGARVKEDDRGEAASGIEIG